MPAAAGRVYLVADEGKPSWREWFTTLAELTRSPKPWLNLPEGFAMALGGGVEGIFQRAAPRTQPPLSRYMAYLVRRDVHFSLAAATAELGYKPRYSWQEGLEHTLSEMGHLRRERV